MRLDFHPSVSVHATLGPAEEFVIRQDGIYAAGERLAAYRHGFWIIDGRSYIECRSGDRACIHAEGVTGRTPAHAPVGELRLADGALYGDGTLLWRREPHGHWSRPGDSLVCDAIVIREPAPASTA